MQRVTHTTNLKIMPRVADLVHECKSGPLGLVEGGFLKELLLPGDENPEMHFRNLFICIAAYQSQEDQAKLFEALLIRYPGASAIIGAAFDQWCMDVRAAPNGRETLLRMIVPVLIAHLMSIHWLRHNDAESAVREHDLPVRVTNLLVLANTLLDERQDLPCSPWAQGELNNALIDYFKVSEPLISCPGETRPLNRRSRMARLLACTFPMKHECENAVLRNGARKLLRHVLLTSFTTLSLDEQLTFLASGKCEAQKALA